MNRPSVRLEMQKVARLTGLQLFRRGLRTRESRRHVRKLCFVLLLCGSVPLLSYVAKRNDTGVAELHARHLSEQSEKQKGGRCLFARRASAALAVQRISRSTILRAT